MQINKLISRLLRQGTHRRAWNRVVRAMACLVVFCTVYALILPALTAEQKTFCGIADHTHTLACYSDPEADVETAAVWEALLPALTGDAAADLAAAARSQLGYTESEKNYQVLPDNSLSGYTRYGAWAGDPYGSWNLYFVKFCLHYAGVPGDWYAGSEDETVLRALLQAHDRLGVPGAYAPQTGDLIFLERGGRNLAGVVEAAEGGCVTVILGDDASAVRTETLAAEDAQILSYGCLSDTLPQQPQTETADPTLPSEEPETLPDMTEETVPETTEPPADTVPDVTEERSETVPETTKVPEETHDGFGAVADLVPPHIGGEAVGLQSLQTLAAGSVDMTDMITEVTMQHRPRGAGENDPWQDLGTGGTVQADDQLRGTITYQVPGHTLSAGNPAISYQLPAGMQLKQVENGIVTDTSGKEVGTYRIDTAGQVTITFHQDYVTKNQNGTRIDGRLTFEGSLDQSAVDSNGKLEMIFNEKCKIELQVEETKPRTGDIAVQKEVQTETESGQLEYKVIVSSTQGTSGPVRVTDSMQYQSFSDKLQQELKVVDQNGNPVDFTLHTKDTDFWNFQLDLPAMAPNSQYVITYPTHANDNTSGLTLTNKASGQSVDSEQNPIVSDDNTSVPFDMIHKKGSYDPTTQMLSWTVEINQDKRDISGWTLCDRYLDAGGWHDYTGDVTLKDSAGHQQTVKLPYLFPEGSRDQYTVTYSIPRGAMDLGANTVHNEARLEKNGKLITSASGNVGVGTYTPMTKQGGELRLDQDGNAILPWTVRLDFSEHSTHHGTINFSDRLMQKTDVKQYFTRAQLEAAKKAVMDAFIAAFPDEDRLHPTQWMVFYTSSKDEEPSAWPGTSAESDTDGQYAGYQFTITKDIPQGSVLEFSYESTGVLGSGKQPLVFPNKFKLYHHAADGEIPYIPENLTVEKIDPDHPGENQSEHFMHDLENGRLRWMVRTFIPERLRSAQAVITEELPDHVDLEELSLKITVGEHPLTGLFVFNAGNTAGASFSAGGKTCEATAVREGSAVKITLPPELQALADGYFELTVGVRIREGEVDWQQADHKKTAAFLNKASMDVGGQNVSDIQTQVVTQNDLHGVISKHGTKIQDTNLVEYKIVVNPNAVDLVPGGDTMVLEDVLSFDDQGGTIHASLVPGSVQVLQYGTNEQIKAPPTYENQSAGNTEKHVLHITVPDQQALLVTYKYRFYGKLDATTSVGNTASINSVNTEDVENHDEIQVQVQQSGAVAQLRGITIIKVDQMDFDIFLSGVRFRLRGWDGSKYVELANLETDDEGKIQLNKTEVPGLTYNTAYQLVETKTDPRYFLDPAVYEFCIENEDTTAYPLQLPPDFAGHHHQDGDQHFITNEQKATALKLVKSWTDEAGQPLAQLPVDAVTVKIYQSAGTEKNLYGTCQLTAANGWQLELTDLPAAKTNPDGSRGEDWHYTVEEEHIPGFSVTYENNDGITSGTIRLTNQKETGYELPETGGPGLLPCLLSGLGCMAGSAALLIRKKKR